MLFCVSNRTCPAEASRMACTVEVRIRFGETWPQHFYQCAGYSNLTFGCRSLMVVIIFILEQSKHMIILLYVAL